MFYKGTFIKVYIVYWGKGGKRKDRKWVLTPKLCTQESAAARSPRTQPERSSWHCGRMSVLLKFPQLSGCFWILIWTTVVFMPSCSVQQGQWDMPMSLVSGNGLPIKWEFMSFLVLFFCLDGPVPSKMESSKNDTKDHPGVSIENWTLPMYLSISSFLVLVE